MKRKQINQISDLEALQPLEEVKVNYYHYRYKQGPLMDKKGIFAGRFDIREHKYFVITETRASKLISNNLFVCSGLYREGEDSIIYDGTYTQNHCKCDESGSNLENEVKGQVTKLKNMKLNEFEKLDGIREMNK